MAESRKMIYTLDEIPKPFTKALFLGIQHVLTMFGATVSVPLILAPAMEMSAEQTALLVASVMLASGVATFFQVNYGTRLPIIQGVSFSFLGPFFAIIGMTIAAGADVSMQYIGGAIILGAIVEMIIGFTGLIGKIQRFVSPVVIGPVIALIGLALYQSGAPLAGGNWWLAGIVIVLGFVFSLILGPKKPFFALFPILLAVVVAYIAALLMGQVDFEAVRAAAWIRLPWGSGGWILPWGFPKFDFGFLLIALAGYLASMIESYGDYHAINAAAEAPPLKDSQISRGIGMEGVGCFFTGLFGGFASTSYTENIGLVGLTKVASRYVVNIAVVVLLILGIVGKVGGVIATIPMPIVGGLYCLLFGMIASIGISNSAKADLSSMRNQMIMGFILFMGLSVPYYFQTAEVAFQPEWLSNIVVSIGSTGMAVAAILGLILDNIIPGTKEERGLHMFGEQKVDVKPADFPPEE
ncbi:MAG: xanthine permease [Firmicutes bacterium ML8_F2]|jgi:solute carrier family 23 (nucleobase transporter), member 1|nr:MAG: xanthine permease [Firmicutes bacterium ML8_F2]